MPQYGLPKVHLGALLVIMFTHPTKWNLTEGLHRSATLLISLKLYPIQVKNM
jgi:hypothetical protein